MVSKDSELQQIRAEVKARERAAGKKMSRLKSKTGAHIAGTSHDIRRNKGKTSRYTKSQLKTYLADLNNFVSRKTQYVGDVNNEPIPKQRWQQFDAVQQRYKNTVNDAFDAVSGLKAPRSDETLHDRMMNMMPTRQRARNRAVNAAYDPRVIDHKQVNGVKALDVLERDLKKRLNPGYEDLQLMTDRASFIKTLNDAGMNAKNHNPSENDLVSMVMDLTDSQFKTVWKYTRLAESAFTSYEVLLAIGSDKKNKPDVHVSDDSLAEVKDYLVWARAL